MFQEIANTAASLSGVITNLNIRESSKTKPSASVSTFFIANLLLVSLFLRQEQIQVFKIRTT